MAILDTLTPEWLKATFLAGVDLTLDDDTPYDDRVFSDSLEAAVRTLERELSIQIDPCVFLRETHDGHREDNQSWWPFRLDFRPLIGVRAFRLKYGGYDATVLPDTWLRVVSYEHGQMHVLPGPGTAVIKFAPGIPLFHGGIWSEVYVPGLFELDYEAGFQSDSGSVVVPEGETDVAVTFVTPMRLVPYDIKLTVPPGGAAFGVTSARVVERSADGFKIRVSPAPVGGDPSIAWSINTVPADMKRAIGLMAAMLPLDIAGDLIAGAGIANFSKGVDGLSMSIGTTASPTNSGYGARVLQFAKELKTLLPALRARYRMPNISIM